jgi:hypothetical protein
VTGVFGWLRASGYEIDDQTLSLDDSIALTRVRPPRIVPPELQQFEIDRIVERLL